MLRKRECSAALRSWSQKDVRQCGAGSDYVPRWSGPPRLLAGTRRVQGGRDERATVSRIRLRRCPGSEKLNASWRIGSPLRSITTTGRALQHGNGLSWGTIRSSESGGMQYQSMSVAATTRTISGENRTTIRTLSRSGFAACTRMWEAAIRNDRAVWPKLHWSGCSSKRNEQAYC